MELHKMLNNSQIDPFLADCDGVPIDMPFSVRKVNFNPTEETSLRIKRIIISRNLNPK